MPKPFKLDEIKKRRVLRRVIEGDSVEGAARAVGCCRRTVERAVGRDSLFAWRLRTARTARDTIRRQLQEEERRAAEAAGPFTPADLLRELRSVLSHAWATEEPTRADFSQA